MPPELFLSTCRRLYGEHWQEPAAKYFKVSTRTLRRWATGKSETPPRAVRMLLELSVQRLDQLVEVVDSLRAIWLDIQQRQRYADPPDTEKESPRV